MTLALGCAAAAAGPMPMDSGFSHEAGFLRMSIRTATRSAETSQALFGRKAAVIERIRALRGECAESGWDGYDAAPMSTDAAYRAEVFIRALPSDLPLPELTAEPDGSIALEWGFSPLRTMTLSIGTSDRLPYAWLDGAERGHAVTEFRGGAISARLIEAIKGIGERGTTIRLV